MNKKIFMILWMSATTLQAREEILHTEFLNDVEINTSKLEISKSRYETRLTLLPGAIEQMSIPNRLRQSSIKMTRSSETPISLPDSSVIHASVRWTVSRISPDEDVEQGPEEEYFQSQLLVEIKDLPGVRFSVTHNDQIELYESDEYAPFKPNPYGSVVLQVPTCVSRDDKFALKWQVLKSNSAHPPALLSREQFSESECQTLANESLRPGGDDVWHSVSRRMEEVVQSIPNTSLKRKAVVQKVTVALSLQNHLIHADGEVVTELGLFE